MRYRVISFQFAGNPIISKREDSLICPLFFMYLLIIPINAHLNSRKSCLGSR